MAKGVKGLNTSDSIDINYIYQRLEAIHKVMQDLNRGREIDLELLTSSSYSDDKENSKRKANQNKLQMVHFNKTLTQINALLCDAYSKRCGQDGDNGDCVV